MVFFVEKQDAVFLGGGIKIGKFLHRENERMGLGLSFNEETRFLMEAGFCFLSREDTGSSQGSIYVSEAGYPYNFFHCFTYALAIFFNPLSPLV